MTIKKVKFKGELYWLASSHWGSDYNLSPLGHYNEDGELLADPFTDISYAVVQGNDIMRFGQKIGELSELEDA